MLNVPRSTKDSKFIYKGFTIIGYNLGHKHYYVKGKDVPYFDRLKDAKRYVDRITSI